MNLQNYSDWLWEEESCASAGDWVEKVSSFAFDKRTDAGASVGVPDLWLFADERLRTNAIALFLAVNESGRAGRLSNLDATARRLVELEARFAIYWQTDAFAELRVPGEAGKAKFEINANGFLACAGDWIQNAIRTIYFTLTPAGDRVESPRAATLGPPAWRKNCVRRGYIPFTAKDNQ